MADETGVKPANSFEYKGEGGDLFMLFLKNLFLTIITAGIYHFWAVAEVRKFHAGNSYLGSDRFGFHGTGGELFLGALKAIGFIILIYALGFGLILIHPVLGMVFFLIIGLMANPLIVTGLLKYRLSRTSFRGILFAYHGDFSSYLALYLKYTILTILTLGIYGPWALQAVLDYVINRISFGTERFSYKGITADLIKPFLIQYGIIVGLILFLVFNNISNMDMQMEPGEIPDLGKMYVLIAQIYGMLFLILLVSLWFYVKVVHHVAKNAALQGINFATQLSFPQILKQYFIFGLITVFTLGFGFAWAVCRLKRYMYSSFSIDQLPEYSRIKQTDKPKSGALGEGLLELDG